MQRAVQSLTFTPQGPPDYPGLCPREFCIPYLTDTFQALKDLRMFSPLILSFAVALAMWLNVLTWKIMARDSRFSKFNRNSGATFSEHNFAIGQKRNILAL